MVELKKYLLKNCLETPTGICCIATIVIVVLILNRNRSFRIQYKDRERQYMIESDNSKKQVPKANSDSPTKYSTHDLDTK